MSGLAIRAAVTLMLLGPSLAAQDISIKNTSSPIGNGRWQWTIYLDAASPILDRVKCVEYHLHPTFPNPLQVVCERGQEQSFALNGNGWGEFNVAVKVQFLDGSEKSYNHWLSLNSSGATKAPKKPSRKRRPAQPLPKPQQ
jgi:transcription initiation factor IIF auxiliary subunit